MEGKSDEYLSLSSESTGIYREKASKFIAHAFPAENEGDVKRILEKIQKDYFDANHHCYAYRIGYEQIIYRTNDDGEPSGSAGKPIYGQILSAGLSDILVVVVRYFGGTKLGIPGLIHAYKSATREALEHAEIITKYIFVTCQLVFEYPVMNQVMRVLKEESVKINNQESGEKCHLTVSIRKGIYNKFTRKISSIRNVQIITN